MFFASSRLCVRDLKENFTTEFHGGNEIEYVINSGHAAKECIVKKLSVFSVMLVVLLALGLVLVSCDNGGDGGGFGGGGGGDGTTFPSFLRGTWSVTIDVMNTIISNTFIITSNTLTYKMEGITQGTTEYSLVSIEESYSDNPDWPTEYWIVALCTGGSGLYDQSYVGNYSYYRFYLNNAKNQFLYGDIYTKQ